MPEPIDLRAVLTEHGFRVIQPEHDPYRHKWELFHPVYDDVALIALITHRGDRREYLQFFTWQEHEPANVPGDPFNIALGFDQVNDPYLLNRLLDGLAEAFAALRR